MFKHSYMLSENVYFTKDILFKHSYMLNENVRFAKVRKE